LSAALLKFGNEHDFPIIELPTGVVQSEVTECVLSAVMQSRNDFGDRNTRAFLDICTVSEEAVRLQSIVDKLHGYLGNPILVEDRAFGLLAASRKGSSLAERSLALRLAPKAVEALSLNTAQILCGEGVDIPCPGTGLTLKQVILPIQAQGHVLGYLSVLEANSEVTDDDRVLLNNCLGVLSVCLSQQLALDFSQWRGMADFVRELLAADFNEVAARHQADIAGFDYRAGKTAVAISIMSKSLRSKDAVHHRLFMNTVSDRLREYLKTIHSTVFIGDEAICIIHFADFEAISAQAAKDAARHLLHYLQTSFPDTDIVVGIGAEAHSLAKCRKSCMEAMDAVKCARYFDVVGDVGDVGDARVVTYGDMGQYALLLSALKDTEAAQCFCDNMLGPLIERSKREGIDLLETLEAWLEENGSNTRAAQRLFVHVNTMKYRIHKIDDILDMDLNAFSNKSRLWLALKIYKYLRQAHHPGI
jgi:sugar diacid utilization regulator